MLVAYDAGMPGTAVLLQGSSNDLKSYTWTYREKQVSILELGASLHFGKTVSVVNVTTP